MAHGKSHEQIIKLIGNGILTAFLLIGNVCGQEASDTRNNPDKTSRSGARINPTSLGMELSIPLGNAPGRGGNSLPIIFNYSSRVWRMDSYRDISSGSPVNYAYPEYGEHSESGWTNSLQPPYLEDSSIEKIIYPPPPPPSGGGCPYVGAPGCGGGGGGGGGSYSCGRCRCTNVGGGIIWRVCPPLTNSPQTQSPNAYYIIPKQTLHLPDGSTQELVASIAPIRVGANENPVFTRYFSIDGSNITLDMSTQSGQPDILRMPDGSRYEFNYDANQRQTVLHVDRHGNRLSYQYNTAQAQGEWIDTLGRTVPVPKVPREVTNSGILAPGDVDYFVPSLPNQPTRYIFKWRRLADSFADASYTVKTLGELFVEVFSAPPHNPVVLQEIVLPNGQSYRFGYNTYGEIEKITHPNGGTERFRYEAIPQFSYPLKLSSNLMQGQGNRGVVEHWISPDNNPANEMRWQYAVPRDSFLRANAPYRVETIAPDASKTERYLYVEPSQSSSQAPRLPSQMAGKVYEERRFSTTGTLVSRRLTKWTGLNTNTTYGSPSPYISSYAKVERTTGITIENGQALAQSQTFSYDGYLNNIRQTTFDYVGLTTSAAANSTIDNIAVGTALKTSQTSYLTDTNYTSRQMVSLPQTATVRNGDENGAIIATSETIYDEAGYGILTGGTLTGNAATTWADPNNLYRANPTTSRIWNSDQNAWIETHAQFDKFGNLRKAWDASNDPLRYTETEYSDTYQCAYPTRIITPAPDPTNTNGTNEGSFATTDYDLTTGLTLTVTNEFGQTTKTEYNDALLRPTRVYGLNFTAPIVETIYDDTNLKVTVRKQIDEQNWDEATTFLDGLGRTIKTQAKDSQGDVFVETQYDGMGRVKQATNPYRNGEQKLWSKPRYDELGRAVESFAPAPDGQTGASLGITSYSLSTVANYIGTVVTATDASLRKSRSITNALGQLVRVDEPTATGGTETADLGTLQSPTQPTIYTYDALGKMVKVQQGGQNRYFKYDSLGRLIRVRQPEQQVNTALNLADNYNPSGQWTAGFSYDVLGNVLTATDAKGVRFSKSHH